MGTIANVCDICAPLASAKYAKASGQGRTPLEQIEIVFFPLPSKRGEGVEGAMPMDPHQMVR